MPQLAARRMETFHRTVEDVYRPRRLLTRGRFPRDTDGDVGEAISIEVGRDQCEPPEVLVMVCSALDAWAVLVPELVALSGEARRRPVEDVNRAGRFDLAQGLVSR